MRITSSETTDSSSASTSSMPRSSWPAASARSRMPARIASKQSNSAFWSAMRSASTRFSQVCIGGMSSASLRPPSLFRSERPVFASNASLDMHSSVPS